MESCAANNSAQLMVSYRVDSVSDWVDLSVYYPAGNSMVIFMLHFVSVYI